MKSTYNMQVWNQAAYREKAALCNVLREAHRGISVNLESTTDELRNAVAQAHNKIDAMLARYEYALEQIEAASK